MTQPQPPRPDPDHFETAAEWAETWRSQLAEAGEQTLREVRKACGIQNPNPTQTRTP